MSSNDKEQKLSQIATVVRALVTSRKPPCFLSDILRDYPEVEGEQLPYRKFGFVSAQSLLQHTGGFGFNKIGNQVCITDKLNSRSAHITSMVRQQKSSGKTGVSRISGTTRGSAPKPLQQANQSRRTDKSWNKSSYSSNVFQNLPGSSSSSAGPANRFINSQNRANCVRTVGDRNNNNINKNSNYDSAQQQNRNTQQQSKQQKSGSALSEIKDLREKLNPKAQQQQRPQESTTKVTGNNQQKTKQVPPQQKQQLISNINKMANGNQVDLRQYLKAKQQHQQQQQQQQTQQQRQQLEPQQQKQQIQYKSFPRPILGQNNGTSATNSKQIVTSISPMEIIQHTDPVAIASANILAKKEKEQKQQQLQHSLQEFALQKQQKEQALQQQTQIKMTLKPKTLQQTDNSLSVQDRLKLKIKQGSTTPVSESSTSADSESMQSPYFNTSSQSLTLARQQYPQPQFHKRNYAKQNFHTEMQSVISPRVFQFNPKLDPITSLTQYCVVRRFDQPEYTIVRAKFSPSYQCRVSVNGSIYSTYPYEYPSEHQAKISCALKAIEQIKQQEAKQPLPPCQFSDRELVDKLYGELLTHPNGLFAKNIPELFENTFKQTLPREWWRLVEKSNKFKLETADTNNYVILFANTDTEDDMNTGHVVQMDDISLPWTKKYWDLYITHCVSTVEIWARLFGNEYNDKYDQLVSEIETHMETKKTRPMSIANKQMYLVCTSGKWHRVRVEEVDKVNGNAMCFYIDYGDTDWLPVTKLYKCESEFLHLPAQAACFSLFGLEDFAGYPCARRHLEAMLPSKSVVGEILTKPDDFYDTESNTCGKIRVVLYDTSSEEDINLNPLLLNDISNDMPLPKLNASGLTNTLATHITDNGDLYLQILSHDIKYVQKLIQQLIESKFKNDQHKITRDDLQRSNVFLICDDSDSTERPLWYRGSLAEAQFNMDDEQFEIFFVDIGKTQRIDISKIFRLEALSMALSKFPPQAVKVRLFNIPECNKLIVGRMRALLPTNCEAMVKISANGVVPLVTVYRHLEKADTLCTINDVIRIEHELESISAAQYVIDADRSTSRTRSTSPTESSPPSFVNITRSMTIASVPNSMQAELPLLKTYEGIPGVGEFFDVRIPMSANPSNFVIQPYKDFPQLKTLMRELQEYCQNNDEFIPADMVKIGQAYAAKNADGFYHRVTVVTIYSCEMIHVCFCDFGDIVVLRSDQLKILPNKFRQLPKMAIQAKLHGIIARNNDWSLDDCLRFRSLTMGQKFVSTVRKISYDKKSTPAVPMIELELIDVTTDEDILIHEVLLKEERALPALEVIY